VFLSVNHPEDVEESLRDYCLDGDDVDLLVPPTPNAERPLTDPVRQIQQAMWRPEYPPFEPI
jgi:hypothetical protein